MTRKGGLCKNLTCTNRPLFYVRFVQSPARVERLIANLGHPRALAQVTAARARLQEQVTAWSHARFTAEFTSIERMLGRGQLHEALAAADHLLAKCQEGGANAFAQAAFDLATAQLILGQARSMTGKAEAALPVLAEAQRQLQALADMGDSDAESMVAVAIGERGKCLTGLGRLDEAAMVYEEAIKRFERLANQRSLAVCIGQLGTVRLLQWRHAEALQLLAAAKEISESLGELGSVASYWHQIAVVYRQTKQFEQAECAYQQSLAIEVQQNIPAEEAVTLAELGSLYGMMRRWEEGAAFLRQAADIFARLRIQMREGDARCTLAMALVALRRYDEARTELLRAIECGKPYGHAAKPWTMWEILQALEQAAGHPQAAAKARQKALEDYLVQLG